MWRTRIFSFVLLAFALFGFSSPSSFADYPATYGAPYTCAGLGGCPAEPDLATAEQVTYQNWEKQWGTKYCISWSADATVPGKWDGVLGCGAGGGGAVYATLGCPSGGTLSGSTCIGGNPPTPCSGKVEYIACGSTSGVSSCPAVDSQGCPVTQVTNTGSGTNICFGSNGVWMCSVQQGTGTAGTPPPTPPASAPAVFGPCPAGQSSGTVNGVQVCVGPGGTNIAPSTPGSSPQNPCSGGLSAGTINGQTVCVQGPTTTSGPTTSITVNNGGTTTITTTQTVCSGGQCVTKTGPAASASAPPGSASGPVTSTTQPQSQFCSQNPGSPLCKSSGSVTGSCSSGFTGTDNSPETVAAVALANLNCSAPASGVPVGPFGPSAAVASNPAQGSVDSGPPSPSAAGACPIAAQTLTIGQMSATVDLTSMCAYFATFRAVLIAFASVMWFLVIGRWRG